MKEVEIKFRVKLNDNNIPDSIEWSATEADFEGEKPCDTLLISMWDREVKNTLSIDLWTNDMEIGEMNSHFYFTFMKMADTYQRATNNPKLADTIRNFANDFARSVEETLKKSES